MINIGNARYAETESELIESLFQPAPTPIGIAKRHKRRIDLMNYQYEVVGVVSCGGVIGAAHKLECGCTWYSYGMPPGLDEMGICAMREAVQSLSVSRDYVKGEPRYSFK